ncbi:MAG TPA: ATP-binding protein [Rubrobacter sp.]
MTTFDELRRIPHFEALSDEALREVAGQGLEKFVPAGEVNGREGEPVEHPYVILEGELRITKEVTGGEVVINTYTPGAFFAEVPLLAGTPFLATGRALTDCRLFLIPNNLFRRMLTEHPPFGNKILKAMAERIQILQSVTGQRERLNSLGTLAAGLAHELNNPAAAARRSAEDLQESLDNLHSAGLNLTRAATPGALTPQALEALEHAVDASGGAETLGELEISEREEDLAFWLEDSGVSEGWTLVTAFVSAGLDVTDLQPIVESVPPALRTDALRYLAAMLGSTGLVDEVKGSALRISGIVETMEGYSYMDRAPVQDVNVNGSLDDTLAVMEHRLDGIEVARDYDPELSRITAYGGELNQVWTNLLDNAIDAVSTSEGSGRITLRTGCERDRVLVEVADDGPGIPPEDHARIFEPFFSTKDVGKGTGLGLDVSYRIVVGRHGGVIHVVSEPGETRFEVRLPVEGAGDPEAVVGRDLRMEAGA